MKSMLNANARVRPVCLLRPAADTHRFGTHAAPTEYSDKVAASPAFAKAWP
jgi:hypothetical protein